MKRIAFIFDFLFFFLCFLEYGVSQNCYFFNEIKLLNFSNPNSSIILAPANTGTDVTRWTLPTGAPAPGSALAIASVLGTNLAFSWITPISLSGNVFSSSDFIGSTNYAPLRLFTNNTERVRITSEGLLGLNTNDPKSILDVRGGYSLLTAPSGEPNDTLLTNSQYTFYVDDTNNALKVKVKKSNGTVYTFGAPTIIKKTIYYDVLPINNLNWFTDATFTVEGAEPGNTIIVNFGSVTNFTGAGIIISWAVITAPNTVVVRFRQAAQNTNTHNLDPMNFYFTVIK